jgi:hypothetical protein
MGEGKLGQLFRGQASPTVVRNLGHLFTLCSHAHQRAASLAFNAAYPQAAITVPAPAQLMLETARDHLRSIAMDWGSRPPTSKPNPVDLRWLSDCPLSLATPTQLGAQDQVEAALNQLTQWLQRLLHMPIDQWLTSYRSSENFSQWCKERSTDLTPARYLATWHPVASALALDITELSVLNGDTPTQCFNLREIAFNMANDSMFTQRPVWRGKCAESGAWTRLRQQSAPQWSVINAWTRLSSRWLELIEIAAAKSPLAGHQQDSLLSSGALPLGDGQAIAWCEMARGLLLHWVQLDDHGRVEDYRVLAPTEWNFHPEGALANALSRLNVHETNPAWCLAAAYDPCVECTVLSTTQERPPHA